MSRTRGGIKIEFSNIEQSVPVRELVTDPEIWEQYTDPDTVSGGAVSDHFVRVLLDDNDPHSLFCLIDQTKSGQFCLVPTAKVLQDGDKKCLDEAMVYLLNYRIKHEDLLGQAYEKAPKAFEGFKYIPNKLQRKIAWLKDEVLIAMKDCRSKRSECEQ